MATTSPGRAPDRRTGSPATSPSAVMAIRTWSAPVRSPPTTEAPTNEHSAAIPSASSSAHAAGRSAGAASPTVSAVARPPIALISERLAAATRCPISAADAQSRRKCRPSTGRAVETTTRPSGTATTAASSPGPSSTAPPWGKRSPSAATNPNSPTSDRVASAGMVMADIQPQAASCSGRGSPHDRLSRTGQSDDKPWETSMVVQAYILIQTDVGKAAEVAAEIAEVKGVTLAEDVTGPYDVIVRAEARNVDELGKLVVARVQNISGITRTLTCPVVHI